MSRNRLSSDTYAEVMERDDRACQAYAYGFDSDQRCDDWPPIVHHRKTKGAGGSRDPSINEPENLVVLCDSHHRLVHGNPSRAYDCGLLVKHST